MATEQTLISIRERPQIDLFDLALVVIRRRPRALGLAALGGIAPFVALNAWIFTQVGSAGPVLGLTLWWFEAPFASAPLTLVLGGMMFGRTPGLAQVARRLLRSSGTLLLTHGLLRFLPVYWLPPRLMFSNEVILLEHSGPGKLWKRGSDLVGGRDSDLLFFGMFQAIGIWAGAMIAYLGAGRLFKAVLVEEMTWDFPDARVFNGLIFQIPIWLGVSYLGVVRFLTYIDQRIRLEGWEIKLRLHAAGEALAEDRKW